VRIVLLDARNVMRSRWPNTPEERLLDLTRVWAEEEAARVVAVFDGQAPEGRLGAHELDERTTVVGTGRGSADDWIAEHAMEMTQGGSRLWLVTSDRALRERVAGAAEHVIGGGTFAAQLEALDPEHARGRRYYRPSTSREETQ
jgi:predicted RNA-binding protein with PIN domain